MTKPIIKTIEVPCRVERAFDIFVTRIATWWPLDSHSASAATGKVALGVTLEPRVGGYIYETMHDGTRADWGEILEFELGRKLAMTWHPGNTADNATRVEVSFEPVTDAVTRVVLTHSDWENWGTQAAEKREMYDGGWDFVLGVRYAKAAE